MAQTGYHIIAALIEFSPHVKIAVDRCEHINPAVQSLVGQRVPGLGHGIITGDIAQIGHRAVNGLIEGSPNVQVVIYLREREYLFVQSLVGEGVPGPVHGVKASDTAQVGYSPIAGLGKSAPHINIVTGYQQRSYSIVQSLVGQGVPGPGGAVVAGDIAQVGHFPIAGLEKAATCIYVVTINRQHVNIAVQALVGQRMPGIAHGIVAGDMAQVGN